RAASAPAAFAHSTRSLPGARSTPPRSAASLPSYPRGGPRPCPDDRRLVFRFRLAVRLSAERAARLPPAAGLDSLSAGAVRRPFERDRAEGPGGNRREARVHLPLLRMAGEGARRT